MPLFKEVKKISKRNAKKEAKNLLWWLINHSFDNGLIDDMLDQHYTGQAREIMRDEIVKFTDKLRKG